MKSTEKMIKDRNKDDVKLDKQLKEIDKKLLEVREKMGQVQQKGRILDDQCQEAEE